MRRPLKKKKACHLVSAHLMVPIIIPIIFIAMTITVTATYREQMGQPWRAYLSPSEDFCHQNVLLQPSILFLPGTIHWEKALSSWPGLENSSQVCFPSTGKNLPCGRKLDLARFTGLGSVSPTLQRKAKSTSPLPSGARRACFPSSWQPVPCVQPGLRAAVSSMGPLPSWFPEGSGTEKGPL